MLKILKIGTGVGLALNINVESANILMQKTYNISSSVPRKNAINDGYHCHVSMNLRCHWKHASLFCVTLRQKKKAINCKIFEYQLINSVILKYKRKWTSELMKYFTVTTCKVWDLLVDPYPLIS